MLTDIAILLVLVFLNGALAMSEIAIVSSRRARLQQLADAGRPGAARALELTEDPTRFLSTIQVGITTIGILMGAIGESGIARALRAWIEQVPVLQPHAQGLALVAMVILVTYVSLIVGELVPKRLAMLRRETIAVRVAAPMHYLSLAARPLVRVLAYSTELVLRLLRARPPSEPSVNEEEIRVLMEQGAQEGVFDRAEQRFVENVLLLDTRRVGSVIVPRMDVVFIELEDPFEVARERLLESPHAEVPLCRHGLEHVVGFLRLEDLLRQLLRGEPPDLAALAEPALFVPENLTLGQLLEQFRRARRKTALAVDEYGEVLGLVSLGDVLGAIVGELPSSPEGEDVGAAQREDGSWLIDGLMDLHELKRRFDLDGLPGEEGAAVHTVSGLLMLTLGRVPRVTDTVEVAGLLLEVVDMDGHRVDKVLVRPVSPGEPPPQ
jgi:putative hemolysin